MHLKNTPETYGAVTKAFHWVTAILVIMMLVMGLTMGSIENLTDKIWVYNLHKSFGVTVLSLTTLRILWHIYSKRPHFVPGMKRWEEFAAKSLHYCLYLALLGMPLSGWLMSSAAGRAVEFFGLFTLPDLIQQNQELRGTFGTIHEFLGYTLMVAIAGHIGAALKHHFIQKDATLRRMLPF